MNLNRLLTIFLYHSLLMAASSVYAGSDSPLFNYSIRPRFINTELVPSTERQLKEARFNSGLSLLLKHNLMNISLDYTLQGQLRNSKVGDRNFNQIFRASMMSSSLNQLLKVNANIGVNSFITEGGNIYSYKFAPVFSKSFEKFAVLNIKYNYHLDKPTRSEWIRRNRGYSLGLKGKMVNGRLTWKSGYMKSSVFKDHMKQSEMSTRNSITLDFPGHHLKNTP